MMKNSRDREDDCTGVPHAGEGAPGDDEVLVLYARFLEPLAGRVGRELCPPEWSDFRERLPAPIRDGPYAQELLARLHCPAAVLLLVDLAYGPRVSQLAHDHGVQHAALAETLALARAIVRGGLNEHNLVEGRVVEPPRSTDDLKTATSALVEIDYMRAKLVQRAARPEPQGDQAAQSGDARSSEAISGSTTEETPQGTEIDGREALLDGQGSVNLEGVERTGVELDESVEETSDALTGRLSSTELAKHYLLDPERVRKALERYRKKNFTSWIEVTDRRPREPRYLYDPKAVAPILQRMRQT